MRYEARFSNGMWKLFDKNQFSDVDVFGRQVDAQRAADGANARDAIRKARG